MRSPIQITKNAWTDEELEEIEKLATQTMERIASQTGKYMDYESCMYAVKLSIVQRLFDDLVRKLASLSSMEGDLLQVNNNEKE